MEKLISEVPVVVGVIYDDDKNILIAQRQQHQSFAGYWEFPGGKVESGESYHDALHRELHEELGIKVVAAQEYNRQRHMYGQNKVLLIVYIVEQFEGIAAGLEGQEVRWVRNTDLLKYKFPEANQFIISSLV